MEYIIRINDDYCKVLRTVVPVEVVEDAMRLINRDILINGLPKEHIDCYLGGTNWFVGLRWSPEILKLEKYIPEEFREGIRADPQILAHFPDGKDSKDDLWPHVDIEPDWAGELKYSYIVGIPLTPQNEWNGGVRIHKREGVIMYAVAEPGDLVVMTPKTPHSSGTNKSGSIRYIVYFRYLKA